MPEIPHSVEVKVPLAVFYCDMTEWQMKAPEYAIASRSDRRANIWDWDMVRQSMQDAFEC